MQYSRITNLSEWVGIHLQKENFQNGAQNLEKRGMLLVELSESEFRRFEMEWKKPPVSKNLTYRAVKYDYNVVNII